MPCFYPLQRYLHSCDAGPICSGSNTSTISTDFERGVNKNVSATCGYVRTLFKAVRLKEGSHNLNQQGIRADSSFYIYLLKECIKMKDLAEGRQVHTHINQSGLKPNILLLNTLINMYGKCGSLVDARRVFETIQERTLFTWSIMIEAYAKNGYGMEAFEIYEQMQREGVKPDRVTFTCVLNACASLGALKKGQQVHADIAKSIIAPDVILENTLVDMYLKCGSMKEARQVFDNMAERDVVSWSAMVAGYAQHGFGREALEIYKQMQREGVTPNRVTYSSILNACVRLGDLEKGKEVHADIIKSGIPSFVQLENAVIDMYAKCDSMEDARQLFDNMAKRDVVSWSVMIAGYAQQGHGREAFELYQKMQQEQVTPDRVTFICILNACASLGALEKGREVHADIIKAGIVSYVNLETALADMYAKCGSMKDAQQVFDHMATRNVVSWSVMMAGYAQHGHGREAFKLYEQMQCEGVTPDRVTFLCVLNVCASLGALEKGRDVHADIIKAGIAKCVSLETALADMYAKCGSMKNACKIFDNMTERNAVSWSAMIAGYAQHGCGREALQLFEQMQQEGLKPDGITFTSLLSLCSRAGLVEEGQHYFESMVQDHGLSPMVEHFGCMVDILGRAGQLAEAEDFIIGMPIKADAGVWRALLGASRIHGDLEVAERAAKSILQCDPHHLCCSR